MGYLNGTPNGQLYVGNVKWSNDYKHVMLFASEAARNSFMTSHLTRVKTNAIYWQPNKYIDIRYKLQNMEQINYCYYINDSDISSTPYCCFVTDYEYIAPRTTRLYIQLDVFQMYHYSTAYYRSFIERAIVSPAENINNKNYLPEPINAPLEYEKELKVIGVGNTDDQKEASWQPVWVLHTASYYESSDGTYHYEGIGTHNTFGEYGRFIDDKSEMQGVLKMYGREDLSTTLDKLKDNIDESGQMQTAAKNTFRDMLSAILSGNLFSAVQTVDDVKQMLSIATEGMSIAQYQDHRDELVGLYAIPKWLKDKYLADGGNANYADNRRTSLSPIDLSLNNSILANGYEPRNKKLLTSICRGYVLANRTGLKIPFKPELFSGTPTITLYGITMSTSGYLYTVSGYSDRQLAHGEVSYASERRVGYDANTGINKALSLIGAAGGMAAAGTAMATGNPVAMIGGVGGITQNLVNAVDSIGTQEAHFGNNGDLLRITAGRPVLRWFEVNPSVSECQAIDNFFDMYGYTIQKHASPADYMNSRSNWNYIKTDNINMHCNAPADYENQLKNIYNSGVTIWHKYNDFGDYSKANGTPT